jgi:putative transposase
MYLWRAVDDEGEVIDILVEAKRDKRPALRLMPKLLKKHGFAPAHWTTDKLPSYGAALRPLGARAGASDRRSAEQPGGEFGSAGATTGATHAALQVTAIGAAISLDPRRLYNTFNVQRRHLTSRQTMRKFRADATAVWQNAVRAA